MAEAVTVELDAQYRQLREECGVLDRSNRGKLLLRGAEVAEYLQGQLTNDIEGLAPGEGCYAALLDRKGHMQADMRALNVSAASIPGNAEVKGNARWIDTEPETLAAVKRHLEMYKIGREIEVEDADFRARDPLAGRPPQRRPPRHAPARPALLRGDHDRRQAVARSRHGPRHRPDRGRGCAAAPASPLPRRARPRSPSKPSRSFVSRPGRPRFGNEMDSATMPAEAGIVEAAVDFEKGCYIGQETVARLHYRGKPNRHLRGLQLSAPAASGAVLKLGEKEVGTVGGGCVSPVHGPIALAILRREAEPGAELAVGEDGVTARVADLPFG